MGSDKGTNNDVVTLKAMRFHARIGVLPHEAEIAQSIEVDASLWVRRPNGPVSAKEIVDYRRVYDLVAEVEAESALADEEDLDEEDRALLGGKKKKERR